MRVVITGSQGFIGRHLVRRCCASGHEVVGVGRTAAPPEGPDGSRYHCCDLSEPAGLLPADCPEGPFVLVHLAWNMQRPWQFHPYADHVARLSGLLDSWVGRGLRMLIVPGSAEEYGQRGGRLREEDPPAGWLSPYGWGKWSVQMLLRCWSAQTGIPVVWLRPFIVYGPGQTGNMVLPYAVRQVQVGAAAELSDGTQQRDFVFIDDVVEAFHAAMQLPPAGFQAINLGSGTPIRVRDVLEYLGQLLGAGDRFQFGARPRRAGEPEMQVADPSRAAAVLGWSARVAWREGVEQVAAWARRGEPWAA